MVGGISMYDDG